MGSVEALTQATPETLEEVPDIGPTIARSAHAFFTNPATQPLLDKLRQAGLRLATDETTQKSTVDSYFTGKSIVLTGTMARYSRDQASELIRQLGGKIISSVSKKTDLLIAGEKAGAKFQKAEKLEIEVLHEEAFVDKLKEAGIA